MISRYGIFAKVMEAGSFTKAAEELGYSQSAVSQTIQSLEKELGTVLLVRAREGISLTRDGESYYPYIQAVYSAEKNLEKHHKEMSGLEEQTIRIGTFTSVSRNLLPSLMNSFHTVYPGVRFELRQGEYDNIHDWINTGEIDFGFIKPEGYDDIEAETIYHDTMSAVIPKNHPLASLEELSLKQLADEPFILLDEGKNSVPLQAFEKEGLHPDIAYKVYDDYSILAMVRQGLGVSVLYRLVTAGFENDVVLRPVREPLERTIAVAYKNADTLSVGTRRFLAWIHAELPQLLKNMGIEE